MRKMRFRSSNCRSLILGVCLAAGSFSWAQVQSKAVVVKAAKHAFAPPLSQLVPIPPRSAALRSLPSESGRLRMPRHTGSPVRDSVLQSSSDAAVPSVLSANSGLNILGVGTGFDGFGIQATVAVPNGAAGPTQFVQIVNDSFAVFNKTNGTVEYGPADGNTLWQALGAPCSTAPNMDEVAQFDKLAQVWVIMMPLYAEPDTLCIAVSTTSSATSGGWNLYAFEVPVTALCGGGGCRPMSDYPKLAVWPDGYYITYNQGGTSSNFLGAAACVVDRAAMLTGAAATMQCFNEIPGSSYGTLLPADVDGTTPPPAGTPEYFASFDYNDQSLDFWQFHVNWTTPADSTYTGPTNIPVAAFLEPCGDTVTEMTPSDNCVPQAGTAEMLGAFGDRLMYRLAYRNFGSYQSIVANHTVQVGTSSNQTGIRWYELRNTGAGFEQYQEGTYAPDSSYRWMGSIAMDKLGDMGLGYNVSSSSLSPSIRYTGRLATDTLGQMESEIDVLSEASVAHTSQTNTVRWGDFSSMAIDPTDDCTFWYTGEYQTTTNSNHWSTRIASFSFPACTQSFPLTVNEVGQGTVTSTDGNINCTNGSGTCSAVYASGSSVTLNATAASGWTFSGWSGSCSGSNPCNLVVNSSTSATATFTSPNYTLTVNESGQGTVTSTDGEISCTNGSGHCSAVYASGSSVTLNATAASGWTFSGWSGPCTGSNPCNLVMNTNLTPTAKFTANANWTLVHEKSNGGAITNLTIPATGTGHLVAVALMFNGKTSVAGVSDNATGGSNTYVSAGARSTVSTWSVEIWYAVNSKPAATVVTPTFAGSPTNVQITVWEVSGLATSAPDATNISSGNVTLNNTVGPMVTTTQRGDFIVSVLLANAADFTAISSGNEFTDDFTTFGNGWAHITSASATAGTHQASWNTAAPTGVYCASTVAFLSN